jgi:hypothetical protein
MRDNMHKGCDNGFQGHALRFEWCHLTREHMGKPLLLGHDNDILVCLNAYMST